MTNRRKTLNTNNQSQTDDDNCSVICYKDSNDGHVGVVRIRQQPVCSACNLMRGTLSLYYKHIVDNNHRENVKKLCDENRFVPSIYDQAIHLAFQNNFYYQSDKFHFLYKHTNEEPNSSLHQIESTETDKMEINNNNNQQKTNTRKRRNIQVTLVFQDKTYSQIGTTVPQIREQLLKDMLTDRANDIAALPMEIYYNKKKIAPDDIHHNGQKGSVILTMVKDQSQDMLKKQHHQEPFENGHINSAEISRKDIGVEQNNVITTHEISTAEKLDVDEQSSFVDDVMNVCKDVLNNIIIDVYSTSDEFKREQKFLSGISRRSFKKKNTFFCDICSIFLTSEKYCIQHINGSDHLEKTRHYQTNFLPWRQAMQKSLITGKSFKEIIGNNGYDNYKATMALYLAPNNLCSRGRFCCAYCELIFTDQWALEKHLHTIEHKEKQTPTDHKELVVRFANVAILPIIFKLNGITHISEVPEDIKTRYQWRCVTRAQLDEDISSFIRNYPFDAFEGATRILNGRAARKRKSSVTNSTPPNLRNNNNNNNVASRNQQGRGNGFNRARRGQFQTPAPGQGTAMKRPFPATVPSNKRFRPDLNNSFPGTNRGGSGPMRNYEMKQYNYGQSVPYNNGNDRWPSHYPIDQQQQQQQQQQQEFFGRSNFELQSLASDNTGYYGSRPPHRMSGGNNYNHDRQPQFNSGGRGYDNQQSNYDPNFMHNTVQPMGEYHPEQNPISLGGPPNRSHHRANTGAPNRSHHRANTGAPNRSHHRANTGAPNRSHRRANTSPPNEFIHQAANNFQRPQHQQQQTSTGPPPTNQMHHQNQNSFGGFAVNNSNNTNSSFFLSPNNQQPGQMGTNGPPIRSYADYRASTGLPTGNTHSSMYQPLPNLQNPVIPQSRTFDEFGLSSLVQGPSNAYRQPGGPSFGNGEPHYNNFGHQNQIEQSPQTSWRGSSRAGNNTRGRRGGGAGGHPQSANKKPGSTFSYSSSNNNNNNNSSMRGRGAGRNVRNFGSRR